MQVRLSVSNRVQSRILGVYEQVLKEVIREKETQKQMECKLAS